jgi:hypothetical protein
MAEEMKRAAATAAETVQVAESAAEGLSVHAAAERTIAGRAVQVVEVGEPGPDAPRVLRLHRPRARRRRRSDRSGGRSAARILHLCGLRRRRLERGPFALARGKRRLRRGLRRGRAGHACLAAQRLHPCDRRRPAPRGPARDRRLFARGPLRRLGLLGIGRLPRARLLFGVAVVPRLGRMGPGPAGAGGVGGLPEPGQKGAAGAQRPHRSGGALRPKPSHTPCGTATRCARAPSCGTRAGTSTIQRAAWARASLGRLPIWPNEKRLPFRMRKGSRSDFDARTARRARLSGLQRLRRIAHRARRLPRKGAAYDAWAFIFSWQAGQMPSNTVK